MEKEVDIYGAVLMNHKNKGRLELMSALMFIKEPNNSAKKMKITDSEGLKI